MLRACFWEAAISPSLLTRADVVFSKKETVRLVGALSELEAATVF